MKRRFIAKRKGVPWCVYDVERASWPGEVPGFGVVKKDMKSEEEAQAEADRLAESV